MNRYPALPREWEDLMAFLDPVDPDRRPSIARLIFAEVATCPTCDRTVRRSDPRRRTEHGLAHVGCTGRPGEPR